MDADPEAAQSASRTTKGWRSPMNIRRYGPVFVLTLACVLALSSCAALDNMASALANLQRLKFKIGSVRDFRLLGLEIGGKSKLADFGASDILRVAQSYSSRKLPVSF